MLPQDLLNLPGQVQRRNYQRCPGSLAPRERYHDPANLHKNNPRQRPCRSGRTESEAFPAGETGRSSRDRKCKVELICSHCDCHRRLKQHFKGWTNISIGLILGCLVFE